MHFRNASENITFLICICRLQMRVILSHIKWSLRSKYFLLLHIVLLLIVIAFLKTTSYEIINQFPKETLVHFRNASGNITILYICEVQGTVILSLIKWSLLNKYYFIVTDYFITHCYSIVLKQPCIKILINFQSKFRAFQKCE